MNVHNTFRRRPGRLLNVLCPFNLRLCLRGGLYLEQVKNILALTHNFSVNKFAKKLLTIEMNCFTGLAIKIAVSENWCTTPVIF